MESWERVRGYQGENNDTLIWWELLVKPGITQFGIKRSKEMNKEKREELTDVPGQEDPAGAAEQNGGAEDSEPAH